MLRARFARGVGILKAVTRYVLDLPRGFGNLHCVSSGNFRCLNTFANLARSATA